MSLLWSALDRAEGRTDCAAFCDDRATCCEVKSSGETFELLVYESFRLHVSGRMWEALRRFHDEDVTSGCDCLRKMAGSSRSLVLTATSAIC